VREYEAEMAQHATEVAQRRTRIEQLRRAMLDESARTGRIAATRMPDDSDIASDTEAVAAFVMFPPLGVGDATAEMACAISAYLWGVEPSTGASGSGEASPGRGPGRWAR
jgi:hypothetical protein